MRSPAGEERADLPPADARLAHPLCGHFSGLTLRPQVHPEEEPVSGRRNRLERYAPAMGRATGSGQEAVFRRGPISDDDALELFEHAVDAVLDHAEKDNPDSGDVHDWKVDAQSDDEIEMRIWFADGTCAAYRATGEGKVVSLDLND